MAMIKLVSEGIYSLIETRGQTKILTMEKHHRNHRFVWLSLPKIGDVLAKTSTTHNVDHIFATGKYRLYDVKNESDLTDLYHLELLTGEAWQGYLLPNKLPFGPKLRTRIIPTDELITKRTH